MNGNFFTIVAYKENKTLTEDAMEEFRNTKDAISVGVEMLMDSLGAAGAIKELAYVVGQIFRDKAEHVRTNWQDEDLAAQWEFAAGQIEQGIYDSAEHIHV